MAYYRGAVDESVGTAVEVIAQSLDRCARGKAAKLFYTVILLQADEAHTLQLGQRHKFVQLNRSATIDLLVGSALPDDTHFKFLTANSPPPVGAPFRFRMDV